MKRKRMVYVGIFLVFTVLLRFSLQTKECIGTIRGAEWEYLSIEGDGYERTEDSPVDRADMGRFFGFATDGNTRFSIYAVKGTEEYLYCRWEWDGWMYRRIQ